MIDIGTIEKFYQYFYAKKYKQDGYRFKGTKTTRGVCKTFLELIDKEYSLHCVGDVFLWDYFLFQFDYWHNLTVTKFNDVVTIAYIVGEKAFDRYTGRNREYDWQMESYPIIELYGVHKKDVFTNREQPKKVNSGAALKELYHNTERGFATCVEFTTLYDPKDKSCKDCIFKIDCQELLRVNYPMIYKNRLIII